MAQFNLAFCLEEAPTFGRGFFTESWEVGFSTVYIRKHGNISIYLNGHPEDSCLEACLVVA
jgi:hypothetical protein